MTLAIFGLLVFAVFLNVTAQIALKLAMQQIGHFEFALHNVSNIALQAINSHWIWFGIFIYILSMIVWLLILSRTQVSIAYPLISLGYVINAIAAYYVFGEPITVIRMTGIFVILVGVYLVARS